MGEKYYITLKLSYIFHAF